MWYCYDDGSVEAEDARDAVTNRAADASTESGEAGVVNVSAGASGELPTPTRRAFRCWSRQTTAWQPGAPAAVAATATAAAARAAAAVATAGAAAAQVV